MSRAGAQRVRELFIAALDEPCESRREYARRAAAGDADLAADVLGLLDVHERIGDANGELRVQERLPRIGAFRVLRTIDAGGMGTVFLCEQEHPSRKVAVKLLHAPLDSPEAKRRFQVEAEALARLSHPGIAHVYACGTLALQLFERPYIAMEHVDGVTLDRYVAERALSLEQRLRLAIDVCHAVHHAHEHAVIHRDLKPSNVLVDAHGRTKLIDFGIARLADATLGGSRTAAGAILGSFGYMSPEQVCGAGDVDRRADVYALGAIAYELAEGALPIDVDTRNPAAAAVAIQGRRPRPLSGKVDAARRRDLESVLFKALAKEPDARYASAADLADELERVVRFEPVRVRRPSALHELALFARRNRGLAATLATLAAVLVASVGVISWLAADASRAAERATDEAARAGAALDWVARAVDSADPANTHDRDPRLLAILDASAEQIPAELESQPLVGAYLARVVGELYRRIGYPKRAEPLLRHALAVGSRERGAGDVETLRAEQSLASALVDLGRLDQAEAHLEAVLAGRERVLGADHPDTLESAGSLGNLLAQVGRAAEAEPLLRRAVEGLARVLGPDHDLAIDALDGLAVLLWERGELDQAEAMLRDGHARLRATRGDGHPRTVLAAGSLGELLRARQEPDAAAEWLRAAIDRARPSIGPDHRALLLTRNNLAVALYESGCIDEARLEFAEVVERRRAALGGEALDTLISVTGLARTLGELGGEDAAAAECERGLAESFDSSPEVARERTQMMILLATSYYVLRRPRAAYALASEAADRSIDDPFGRGDRCVLLGFLARLARDLELEQDAAAYAHLFARECRD